MSAPEITEKMEIPIRTFVNRTCGVSLASMAFPGGQPVSLSRTLLQRVSGHCTGTDEKSYLEYALSYKADGQRMLLGFLATEDAHVCFSMDRTGTLARLSLVMPPTLYEGTLFDVEVVGDTIVVFDCACVYGNVCVDQFYPKRLELARHALASGLSIRHTIGAVVPSSPYAYPSKFDDIVLHTGHWKLKVKTVFYASSIKFLPDTWFLPEDGFIWTLTTAPFFVRGGRPFTVLKWKPLTRITIDFLVGHCDSHLQPTPVPHVAPMYQLVRPQERGLFTVDGHNTVWFSFIDTTVTSGIYECSWDHVAHEWQIVLPRPDKTRPNTLSTVVKTIENIADCISREDLNTMFM